MASNEKFGFYKIDNTLEITMHYIRSEENNSIVLLLYTLIIELQNKGNLRSIISLDKIRIQYLIHTRYIYILICKYVFELKETHNESISFDLFYPHSVSGKAEISFLLGCLK